MALLACGGSSASTDAGPKSDGASNDGGFDVIECSQLTAEATVIANLSEEHQTIDGFGSSVRLFNDPHVTETFDPATRRAAVVIPPADQDAILKLLYDDINLQFVRPATEAKIETTNDNNDPNSLNLGGFDFEFKSGDGYIEYVKSAQGYGDITHFLSPISIEDWMNEGNVEEYAEWAIANILHWQAQGLEPKYYSILNEPSYVRGRIWSPEFVRDAVKAVGRRLDNLGLDTKLIIPDDVRSSDAAQITEVVLNDSEAKQYIGALATHLYDEPLSNVNAMKALSDEHGIPLWMTEFSIFAQPTTGVSDASFMTWSVLMHQLLADYDFSNIMYMWAFFGQWDGYNTSLITIQNSGDTYVGYTINKHFYAMGQFSNFIPKDAKRVTVDYPSSETLRISAYKSNNRTSFVIINQGDERSLSLRDDSEQGLRPLRSSITNESESLSMIAPTCSDASETFYMIPADSIVSIEFESL